MAAKMEFVNVFGSQRTNMETAAPGPRGHPPAGVESQSRSRVPDVESLSSFGGLMKASMSGKMSKFSLFNSVAVSHCDSPSFR